MSVYSAIFGTAKFNQSYFNTKNPGIFIKEKTIEIDQEIDNSIDIETEIDISAGETN